MTIFSKILSGQIPCTKVFEDEHVLAFDDVTPQAPVHVLIIPKVAFANLNEATPAQQAVLGHMLVVAKQVAELKGVSASGYRVVFNTGADAGQSVLHIHAHVLGGRPLAWPPG